MYYFCNSFPLSCSAGTRTKVQLPGQADRRTRVGGTCIPSIRSSGRFQNHHCIHFHYLSHWLSSTIIFSNRPAFEGNMKSSSWAVIHVWVVRPSKDNKVIKVNWEMNGKRSGGDLEDLFFIDSPVWSILGDVFSRRTGLGKPPLLSWFQSVRVSQGPKMTMGSFYGFGQKQVVWWNSQCIYFCESLFSSRISC